jgi:Tol biopolymer transport system component
MNTQDPNPRFILKTMDVYGGDVKTVYDGGPGVAIKNVWPPGNYDATWSPNDRWIVFERAVEDTGGNAGSGIWHIFKVKTDGSRIVDLSLKGGHTDRAEYLPSFSSDGKRIVIGSIYEGTKSEDSHIDIFTMDAKDGTLSRLTRHPANDMFPAWIPSGK